MGLRFLVVAHAAAFGLLSCGSHDVVCQIDSSFSDHEQSSVRLAADSWNAIASHKVTFNSDADWLILRADTTGGSLGLEQASRHLIRISPLTPDDQVYAVALHELGHALGLGHVPTGVMDPIHQTMVFSDDDMAECRRVGACR
jgi:hypothetical protein